MKYSYYVVYNYYKYGASGSGSLTHERNDKIDNLEKILKIQADVLDRLKQDDNDIASVIVVNFILMSEAE